MRRREFLGVLGGAAATWPFPARAQQGERVRRIGVIMNLPPDDPEAQLCITTFQQELKELGWSVGRNAQIDFRWGPSSIQQYFKQAEELVALAPDVILGAGGPVGLAVQRANPNVPVVLAQSIDPVGTGVVASLARPGGNITDFTQFEYSLSGKWLEVLREIAPGVKRVGVLREPVASGIGQWAVIQAGAEPIGMELVPIAIRNASEIERSIIAFERGGHGGLIVSLHPSTTMYRQVIIANASRHRLPAVYPARYFVSAGGLISFGADLTDQYRRAAGYVDRILRGEKPANLPVQRPTKYELVINLKTAKALGLTVPPTLLARADEVIE